MKLFICNQGKHRSRTAAELFGGDCAGIYSEERPITKELLERADTIYFMEESQRLWVVEHFPEIVLKKKLLTLTIPDVYAYNDTRLIQRLRDAMKTAPGSTLSPS